MPLVDKGTSRFINRAAWQSKDVPIIGKWFGRVGRVAKILSFPCQPEPEIWVQAFFQAAGWAAWHTMKPTPTDYLANRSGFGGGHRKSGRNRNPRFHWDLQKFDEMHKYTPGGSWDWYLLKGAHLLRHIGWYLTIIDATTEGLVNWVSLSYLYTGCQVPGGQVTTYRYSPDAVFIFQDAWLPAMDWLPDYSSGPQIPAGGMTGPVHMVTAVTWSIAAAPFPGAPEGHIEFRARGLSTGHDYGESRPTTGPDGTTYHRGIVAFTQKNFAQEAIMIEYKNTNTYAHMSGGGTMTCTTAPLSDGIGFDP